jgi:hypothetical protein
VSDSGRNSPGRLGNSLGLLGKLSPAGHRLPWLDQLSDRPLRLGTAVPEAP